VRLVFGAAIPVTATADDPDAATELTERLRLAVESLT